MPDGTVLESTGLITHPSCKETTENNWKGDTLSNILGR